MKLVPTSLFLEIVIPSLHGIEVSVYCFTPSSIPLFFHSLKSCPVPRNFGRVLFVCLLFFRNSAVTSLRAGSCGASPCPVFLVGIGKCCVDVSGSLHSFYPDSRWHRSSRNVCPSPLPRTLTRSFLVSTS